MAKKKLSRFTDKELLILIFLGLFFIGSIVQFISENIDTIITILAILAGLIITFYIVKFILYMSKVKKYKQTKYFFDTKVPYRMIHKYPGIWFESKVYDELSNNFPNARLLTNLLIPRKDSVNEYSEIDILFLHTSGLYVLELKNYKGFIFGGLNDEKWNVGYKINNKRRTFEFLNPLIQNKKHIIDLNKHFSHEFLSKIIFSEKTEMDSQIDSVSYLKEFINKVSSLEKKYTLDELNEIYEEVKKINVYEKIGKHIERIKFNEEKYSKYKEKK